MSSRSKAPSDPVWPRSPRDPIPPQPPDFDPLASPPDPPVALEVITIHCHRFHHRIGLMTDGTIWRIDCPGSASELHAMVKHGNSRYTTCSDWSTSLLYYADLAHKDPSYWRARGSKKTRLALRRWFAYLAHHSNPARLIDLFQPFRNYRYTRAELRALRQARRERPESR